MVLVRFIGAVMNKFIKTTNPKANKVFDYKDYNKATGSKFTAIWYGSFSLMMGTALYYIDPPGSPIKQYVDFIDFYLDLWSVVYCQAYRLLNKEIKGYQGIYKIETPQIYHINNFTWSSIITIWRSNISGY